MGKRTPSNVNRIPTGQLFGTSPLNEVVPQGHFPEISPRLQAVLQEIVTDVVAKLGCVGAMVTTLEQGNALPVRAYSLRFSVDLLERLERQAGVTLIGPSAVVYLDHPRYRNNISARSVTGQNGRVEKFLITEKLSDLLTPIVPSTFADLAQKMTGIRHIIGLPFFIEGQVVGNLLVATRDHFSQRDIDFLTAFGQQAANAIQSQRRLDQMEALERTVLDLQSHLTDETQMLQTLVEAIVDKLDYFGAAVGTVEADDKYQLRAYSFDLPAAALRKLEAQGGIYFAGPQTENDLRDPRFQTNLTYHAVQAARNGAENRFLLSGSLYDFFRPLVNKDISDRLQRSLGIRGILAFPFFLENEVLGNIYVFSRSPYFSEHDKAVLSAFGQQAAIGIRNSRLYRRAEDQRQIAQTLARLAFSASAYVHTLRNHVGAFGNYLMLAEHIQDLPPDQRHEVEEIRVTVGDLIDQTAHILDNLHQPWRQKAEVPTDVNQALYATINKIYPNLHVEAGQTVVDSQVGVALVFDLSSDLPCVNTSPEMLIEVFSILVNNAIDAIKETDRRGMVWLSTKLDPAGFIVVTVRDNGRGIRPEDLNHIFEMGWTTREEGMGFGLFWLKDFVEGLGGSIFVDSKYQQGATFSIRLPIINQEPVR